MITWEYCEKCKKYQPFLKEGKHDSPNSPWLCPECLTEIKEFPKYFWPHAGVKSRKELKICQDTE